MIYLDNSATGGYKPPIILDKVISVIKNLNANPGRSGHKLSVLGSEIVFNARKKLSEFFNNGDLSRVIFTKNCSEALNTAIYGIVKPNTHVITTVFEHNSTLRPLFNLKNKGVITLSIATPENKKFITYLDILKHIKPNTSLVCLNNISNVNGAVNDVEKIGLLCNSKNITFLVDGAQSGGHVLIDMQKQFIDVLALAGHKGLYGIAGSGALLFKKDVEISPTFQGGTGTETFNLNQPDVYPEKLEYGSLNLPAICSIYEGVKYLEKNINTVSNTLIDMSDYLIKKLYSLPKIRVYSQKNPAGIVAFSIENLSSSEACEELSSTYNIALRGGFHCAPLMHKFLQTQKEGLIRASMSVQNTFSELDRLITALEKITSA